MTSVTGAVFADIGAYVVVTYSYNESTGTKRTVSLQLPFNHRAGFSAATTSTDAEVSTLKFFIEDANVALLQSGILMYLSQSAIRAHGILRLAHKRIEGIPARPDTTSGLTTAVHRIDSGPQRERAGLHWRAG